MKDSVARNVGRRLLERNARSRASSLIALGVILVVLVFALAVDATTGFTWHSLADAKFWGGLALELAFVWVLFFGLHWGLWSIYQARRKTHKESDERLLEDLR